jgi:hypothetical protein
MELQRYEMGDYCSGYVPNDDGEVCMSYDVRKLEANMDETIRLLIEARHVCAYPDMNTGLLAEIDTLLKELGETNLPELY